MTTILIIAHAPLASALRAVAVHTYPECAGDLRVLDVSPEATVDQVELQARALLPGPDTTPALVLVDAYGATPCNAGMRLLDKPLTRVVAGVNVPMLWRTLCYAKSEPLDALVTRAVAGATQGVVQATAAHTKNRESNPETHDQDQRQDQQ